MHTSLTYPLCGLSTLLCMYEIENPFDPPSRLLPTKLDTSALLLLQASQSSAAPGGAGGALPTRRPCRRTHGAAYTLACSKRWNIRTCAAGPEQRQALARQRCPGARVEHLHASSDALSHCCMLMQACVATHTPARTLLNALHSFWPRPHKTAAAARSAACCTTAAPEAPCALHAHILPGAYYTLLVHAQRNSEGERS